MMNKIKGVFYCMFAGFLILTFNQGCTYSETKKESEMQMGDTKLEVDTTYLSTPELMYVEYGYYFGECSQNCTRMYRHYLTGNVSTMWTDSGDTYFSNDGTKWEFKMSNQAMDISDSFIQKIPVDIFTTKKTYNKFGCPDCTDGGGLYFKFLLNDGNQVPVVYRMEYDLSADTGSVKILGELIKSTIKKLEKYRN